jgi:serine carboxypeptidase-like clade 2
MILSLLCVIGLGYAAPTEDLVDPSTWAKFKIPYAGKL